MTPGLLLVFLILSLLLFPHRVIDQVTSNHKLSHHLLHPVLASLTTETLETKLVARFSIKKLFLITYHESFKEKNEGLILKALWRILSCWNSAQATCVSNYCHHVTDATKTQAAAGAFVKKL